MTDNHFPTILLKLEICNGVLTFFDNGNKSLVIDLKVERLDLALQKVYVYLSQIIRGLYNFYRVREVGT